MKLSHMLRYTAALGFLALLGVWFLHRATEQRTPHPAFPGLLARLECECDPGNFGADYDWSTKALPTETKRDALLAEFRSVGPDLLPDIHHAIQTITNDETRDMLVIAAAALGDKAQVLAAARKMVWAESPAVRLSAARELRRLHDSRTIEWFELALKDDRFVLNCDCQSIPLMQDKFYPVRTIAELSLREMGMQVAQQ